MRCAHETDSPANIYVLPGGRACGLAQAALENTAEYVVDRRSLGLRGRLREVVEAAFGDATLRSVLSGDHQVERDAARRERAVERLRQAGLNDAQVEAGAAAIATQSLALVQGPPGTGKTRLLAEVVVALCAAGCRIALCAFTHRAVDNAVLAIREVADRAGLDLPIVKLGKPRGDAYRPLSMACRIRRECWRSTQ